MAVGDYHNHETTYRRARQILRAVPEPGWEAIESSVVAAVRATPRGGWPLDVDDPDPATTSGVLRVSDLALGAALGRALRGDPDYVVTHIEHPSDDGVLQRVSIFISGRYGADLTAAAGRVRRRAAAVVADVLGPSRVPEVEVEVTDVHR